MVYLLGLMVKIVGFIVLMFTTQQYESLLTLYFLKYQAFWNVKSSYNREGEEQKYSAKDTIKVNWKFPNQQFILKCNIFFCHLSLANIILLCKHVIDYTKKSFASKIKS